MHITIICGSTRDTAQSLEVSAYIAKRLREQGSEVTLIDLNADRLPLYNDSKDGSWTPVLEKISHTLTVSDGFVFVSPEWDGMFSVGIHNMFHYLDKELADKPVMLVGVSSGRGGRYPLPQMRSLGYKNKRFVVIPESVFIDHVTENLVDGEMINDFIKERMGYALSTLQVYAEALTHVRNSGVIDYERFPNGW